MIVHIKSICCILTFMHVFRHFQLKQEPCAVGKDSTTQNVVPVFIHIGCNCAALARTSQVSIQEPEVISYDTESDSDKDDDGKCTLYTYCFV